MQSMWDKLYGPIGSTGSSNQLVLSDDSILTNAMFLTYNRLSPL